jgi:hypothetical protein
MLNNPASALLRLFEADAGSSANSFAAEQDLSHSRFLARWIFLRALGLIYFSAFFSLLFQIRGLIGPQGILPAADYLSLVSRSLGALRFWYAPSLLWFSAASHMLMALCWIGLAASVLLVLNFWPRASLLICFVCFLSFVSAAEDFSGYQSDGMLLEAGFLSLFLAPAGIRPGLALKRPPMLASVLMLLWEWFRTYFESGVVKLQSGDPEWRHLTAMYEYYQNGPLPTWVGWYVEQLPHWFHIATAGMTLFMELGLVFLAFFPRPWRIACFFIVTAWQIGVILTANYAFLNYLVLVLAILLLDDQSILRLVPRRWRQSLYASSAASIQSDLRSGSTQTWKAVRITIPAVVLSWILYATTLPLLQMFWKTVRLPIQPVTALEPFRIANQYGLFAVMTPHRYEIEFQGSTDGKTWAAYPFRYKPQDPYAAPRIYAPYQPRFDWNLWFASLGDWQNSPIVPRTEELLLANDADVLGLFAGNPFTAAPPRYVRAVLWQYWFSTPTQKHDSGAWWRRELLGTYAPTITRNESGECVIVAEPALTGPPS